MKLVKSLSLISLTLGLLSACGSNSTQSTLPLAQAATEANGAFEDTRVSINPGVIPFAQRMEAASLESSGKHSVTLLKTEQGNVEFFKKELIVDSVPDTFKKRRAEGEISGCAGMNCARGSISDMKMWHTRVRHTPN